MTPAVGGRAVGLHAHATHRAGLDRLAAGFQVGGPIYIPKIYDGRNKTFLFFSQGLYYARLGGAGGLQTVPRNDFKTGDFRWVAEGMPPEV